VSLRRIDGAELVRAEPGTTLVAVGNYDGVHRGHQAVIAAAAERALADGLRPLVLTFHPHPHDVLGGRRHQVLTNTDRKVELLLRIHPELSVVVEPFTRELASRAPESFVRDILVERLGAREVLVGENFRFGRKRAGDLMLLRRLGAELGFQACAEPLHGDATGAFSSTRVRAAIDAGDLRQAEWVLGRPHALSGVVVAGDGRGRALGFRTANLDRVTETLPPDGVYACLVDELTSPHRASRIACGVANLGVRPTADAGRSIEVHLLDVERDLYGRQLRVHLVERLREERRFANLDELARRIVVDIEAARVALAARRPDPEASGAWH
jgi:riboflavin kinase/FMN adenylyltransferase